MSYIAILSYLTAALGVCSFFTSLVTPLLFALQILGIQYYIIRKDDEKTRAIAKVLQKTTLTSISTFQCGNFYPSGCFVGSCCAGYYTYSDTFEGISVEIHLFTTPAYFKTLFHCEQVSVSFTDKKASTGPSQPLTIYSRTGSYTNIYYSRLRIDIQDLEPRGQQAEVVDSICSKFVHKRRGVFFIHGTSGAGKSTIGLLVANRLKGTFCHTFNPSDPGDTLPNILRESEPTDEHPTIILLEEVNTLIHEIHDATIQKHKNITTCVHSKSTYNTFIDDLILYKNVLFIMTSNESKESIDALDPCYLRKGRVDEYYSMMDTLTL